MPIFEYRCAECDHIEEVLQKHSDPAPETCPACGKQHTLSRELSVTSFQLKGGGWYKDLYASTKKGDAASTSSETKSDAKPAAETKATETKTTDKGGPSSSSSGGSSSGSSGSSGGGGGSTASPAA